MKGIANAHIEAAKKANTSFFYVVDGDTEIHDSFKFNYKPSEFEAEYVHIWHAYNPAIGMDYGYGGVKLFSKKFFKNVKSQLDFSTSLTKDIKIMPEIACTTRFNSDIFRSFRGAFREVVKLYSTSTNNKIAQNIKDEARDRLAAWMNPVSSCNFRQYIISGAKAGISEAKKRQNELADLLFINDHDMLNKLFIENYPEIDPFIDPTPKDSNPMKHETFFTSRIASALYDPYVLENLPITELRDAISDGQLLSKLWIVEELNKLISVNVINATNENKARMVICGGWIGTLALLFNSWEIPLKVTSIDNDERANRIAEKLNYDYDFKTVTTDMYSLDYTNYDIITNTSSEHIPDIYNWRHRIPEGKIIIIQNNNFKIGDGHISCVENDNELRKILNLSEVLYQGTRTFPQYSRFMIIGRT